MFQCCWTLSHLRVDPPSWFFNAGTGLFKYFGGKFAEHVSAICYHEKKKLSFQNFALKLKILD